MFWKKEAEEYRLLDLGNEALYPGISSILGQAEYDGKYTWYGNWENDARPVIKIYLLKGNSGILEWGWNFRFLPEIHSGKLQYYRTDKNSRPQLRNLPLGFVEMKEWRQSLIPCYSSDKNKLLKQIRKVWKITAPEIESWYQHVNSYERMVEELDRQIAFGKYYSLFYPSQEYIKAFLLARLGRGKEAEAAVKESDCWKDSDDLLKYKVLEKLRKEASNHPDRHNIIVRINS